MSRFASRRFPAGSVLLAEGDGPSLMYVILSGAADILIRDRNGELHRISSVAEGDTIGEMSLLTGNPVSATVRATSDVDVLVLTEPELQRTMALFPILYRNLGAILSERLAQSNRRTLRERVGEVSALIAHDPPPLLGYALACSVAWHTRKPTILLRVANEAAPDVLSTVGTIIDDDDAFPVSPATTSPDSPPRAELMLATRNGMFAPERLHIAVQRLRESFDYVMLEWHGGEFPEGLAQTVIQLYGSGGPPSAIPGDSGLRVIHAWDESGGTFGADLTGVLRVPHLTRADEQAIASGMLATTSKAGRALGWAARDLTGLKVGLALGGGSIKGYAHLGVLRCLEQIGVPIDCLAGTSIGAAVASAYGLGYDLESVADILDDVGGSAFRLRLPTSSVLSMSGIREGVQRIGGNKRFEDLPLPLGVVAVDIVSGNEIVFKRGLLWTAVLASMAIPGVYPPQRIGHHILVDGGVLNPVPSSVAAGLGADIVIAVKLASRASSEPVEAEGQEIGGKTTSVVQAITRSVELMQGKIGTDTANAATIQIEPSLGNDGGWGLRAFKQGRRYIEAGVEATELAIPRMTAALPWLRP